MARAGGWLRSGLFGPQRLVAYAMLLFLLLAAVQLVASVAFYETIDRDAAHEDHARRVAELLVVSDRVHRTEPALTARIMSSHYLDAHVAAAPSVAVLGADEVVRRIHRRIIDWEPELARRPLTLAIVKDQRGGRDLAGSMQLVGGNWLNFRSRDLSPGWASLSRATSLTLGIALICVVIAFGALHILLAPLRRLSEAVERLPSGAAAPISDVRGPSDVRSLVRSFNGLRARIVELEENEARSFEAISHDLRTPLSRLVFAADYVPDSEVSQIVRSSADEMEAMLMSLQRFLRAQHLESTPEPVDLTALVRDLIAGYGARATLAAPDQARTVTHRQPLALALAPLVENALQYGSSVQLLILPDGAGWRIEIADDGPGMPEAHFQAVLDPFFRGDAARPRDTVGFGLGIPTAHRLLTRFGGALDFRNGEGGGLVVGVTVPPGA